MSLTNTTVSEDYLGDGSAVSFPIPFDYYDDEQVFVKSLDMTTDVETVFVQGVDYDVTDPNVVLYVAPTTDEQITVYRVTAKTQIYTYLETGSFKQEDHEKAMNRLAMMMQELDAGIVSNTIPGGGAFDRLSNQAIAALGTVTISTSQRLLIYVQGSGGPQTASSSTPIADGEIDGQELRLVGLSDSNTLEIVTGGNVKLNGPNLILAKNSVFDFMWNGDDSNWIETSRSA